MILNRKSKVFDSFNYVLLSILALTCLLPFVHIVAVSFSSSSASMANYVKFWPVDFTIEPYLAVFKSQGFIKSFEISVFRVLIGTSVNLFMIILTAYPLSKEAGQMKGRNVIIWYFIFPMMFSGGLIPFFLVIKNVGLINNFLVLILPSALPIFSMIMLMNFFRGLPKSLYEAAVIDGAGHWSILRMIYLPLSTAAIASLALFSMVDHWNEWFTAMIFINDKNQWPLQTYLRQMLLNVDWGKLTADEIKRMAKLSNRSYRAAQLFLATLPILCVYPFLQKYFVKGITLGSIKE